MLGDNGMGKTSVVRAISAALVGPEEFLRFDPVLNFWVTKGEKKAEIELVIEKHSEDKRSGKGGAKGGVKDITTIHCKTIIEQEIENGRQWKFKDRSAKDGVHPNYYVWGTGEGWFSAAFGPYRRFTGGNQSLESFYVRNPKIGAHLTAFKEDAALTENVVWLKDIHHRAVTGGKYQEYEQIPQGIIHFVNQPDLLPDGYKLVALTPDGPIFTTPSGDNIPLYELSEGLKSVTSIAFELLRLLVNTFSVKAIFKNFIDENSLNDTIDIKGIVLIDEIDLHLHPTWQARIGHWFTKCFPNIQFIVTTHSPVICRAAANGTIWHLTAKEDGATITEVKGVRRNQLLYGDILDAFGTELFGHNITRDPEGHEKLDRLAYLNTLQLIGKATKADLKERSELLSIFPNQ